MNKTNMSVGNTAGWAAEPIYLGLREKILNGDLPPGAPLRQDEIARQSGVSKIPVREALLKLQREGYVVLRRNYGATVRNLTPSDIRNILDVRSALEGLALRCAVPSMAQTDLDQIQSLLTAHADATNLVTLSNLNAQFHNALYEPSENTELLSMIAGLQQRIGPYLRQELTNASGIKRSKREHEQIFNACNAGDVSLAVQRLTDHIEHTKLETLANLRSTTTR